MRAPQATTLSPAVAHVLPFPAQLKWWRCISSCVLLSTPAIWPDGHAWLVCRDGVGKELWQVGSSGLITASRAFRLSGFVGANAIDASRTYVFAIPDGLWISPEWSLAWEAQPDAVLPSDEPTWIQGTAIIEYR